MRLLLPHAAKWRIVANAFGISPDSLGKHETDEASLRELLVLCVDQHDFQFRFEQILGRLNTETEEETKMTSNKQGI